MFFNKNKIGDFLQLIVTILFISFHNVCENFVLTHTKWIFDYLLMPSDFFALWIKKSYYFCSNILYIKYRNEFLQRENDKLKMQLIDIKSETDFNDEINKLALFFKQNDIDFKNSFVFARVVNLPGNEFLFLSTIGVESGDLILSVDGVVGRVVSINDCYCRCISISHKDFKIKIKGFLSNSEGIAYGNGGELIINSKSSNDKFEIGEDVITKIDDKSFFVGKVNSLIQHENVDKYVVSSLVILPTIAFSTRRRL
ncbi:rod shape-determining protein MreC [Candidatus Gromoviella agglomerans]|uniref:rod shape-determining protein MreC n=1 Tax=Candidatus Gromoviella agglomerans TaxID=2806609 RepID=UPI001E580C3F|nr:rod shape-determining protein MreC [Candidatus Gromoviella agglomerans]UFX98441.1 Rod shape-determining protein MreC [Candidatus Gromoviella agglomerans]